MVAERVKHMNNTFNYRTLSNNLIDIRKKRAYRIDPNEDK